MTYFASRITIIIEIFFGKKCLQFSCLPTVQIKMFPMYCNSKFLLPLLQKWNIKNNTSENVLDTLL